MMMKIPSTSALKIIQPIHSKKIFLFLIPSNVFMTFCCYYYYEMSAIQIIEFSAPEIEEGKMRDEAEIKKDSSNTSQRQYEVFMRIYFIRNIFFLGRRGNFIDFGGLIGWLS